MGALDTSKLLEKDQWKNLFSNKIVYCWSATFLIINFFMSNFQEFCQSLEKTYKIFKRFVEKSVWVANARHDRKD